MLEIRSPVYLGSTLTTHLEGFLNFTIQVKINA